VGSYLQECAEEDVEELHTGAYWRPARTLPAEEPGEGTYLD
jgi:hypothetical protein